MVFNRQLGNGWFDPDDLFSSPLARLRVRARNLCITCIVDLAYFCQKVLEHGTNYEDYQADADADVDDIADANDALKGSY